MPKKPSRSAVTDAEEAEQAAVTDAEEAEQAAVTDAEEAEQAAVTDAEEGENPGTDQDTYHAIAPPIANNAPTPNTPAITLAVFHVV